MSSAAPSKSEMPFAQKDTNESLTAQVIDPKGANEETGTGEQDKLEGQAALYAKYEEAMEDEYAKREGGA
jgi:hypothetical protein